MFADSRTPQLPPNVPEMLALADVRARYQGGVSGRWILTRGGALITTDPFPNYDDFVMYVRKLMGWKCSEKEATHAWARERAR